MNLLLSQWTLFFLLRIMFEFHFLFDIFFIYISNVIPFPGFPSENPLYFLLYSLLLPGPGSPLYWGIEPSQDQGLLLPSMTDWAIPLLHMQLEPWVPPCVSFRWWFSPRELWGYWLVHIVVPPMELQTPSVPWVLSLAPSLGTLCSDQWMAVSIHFCICQSLAEPLRTQL